MSDVFTDKLKKFFNLFAIFLCIFFIIFIGLIKINGVLKSIFLMILLIYIGLGIGFRISIKIDDMSMRKKDKHEKTPSFWLENEISKLPLKLEIMLGWSKVNKDFNSDVEIEKINWLINGVKSKFSRNEREKIIALLSISPSRNISDVIITVILSFSGIQFFLNGLPIVLKNLAMLYSRNNKNEYPFWLIATTILVLSIISALIYSYIVIPIKTEKKRKIYLKIFELSVVDNKKKRSFKR